MIEYLQVDTIVHIYPTWQQIVLPSGLKVLLSSCYVVAKTSSSSKQDTAEVATSRSESEDESVEESLFRVLKYQYSWDDFMIIFDFKIFRLIQ